MKLLDFVYAGSGLVVGIAVFAVAALARRLHEREKRYRQKYREHLERQLRITRATPEKQKL